MRSLQEYIKKYDNERQLGKTLHKHLSAVNINEWSDVTRGSLYDLRDHLAETLAPNSQRTVMSHVKSMLNRVKDDIDLPKDFEKILTSKYVKPLKTYLTEEDLDKLTVVKPKTIKQEYVKNVFLICAYTGLRVSDAMRLTLENIVGDNLHFVAKKTKKTGAIPLKTGVADRIRWVSEHPEAKTSENGYNKLIKSLCKRAGITEEVLVFKGGKELRGPKWKFVSSHTARISIATGLSKRGVQIGDICQLLQHSDIQMTERYIIRDHIELSDEAMKFFK